MTLIITTPDKTITKPVKAETEQDKAYYLKWVERGYEVKELAIHRKPFEECQACSA